MKTNNISTALLYAKRYENYVMFYIVQDGCLKSCFINKAKTRKHNIFNNIVLEQIASVVLGRKKTKEILHKKLNFEDYISVIIESLPKEVQINTDDNRIILSTHKRFINNI